MLTHLIYICDLADGLSSNAKLFADDTSLFSVVHNANTTANELNNHLVKINRCAYQWRYHPLLALSNNNVLETNSQNHLGVVLDNRLSLEDHLKMILNKANKTIGILRKRQNILLRSTLLTIHKSFIRQ